MPKARSRKSTARTVQFLRCAADYINIRGLSKGALAKNGRVCVLGALNHVTFDDYSPLPPLGAVSRVLRTRGFDGAIAFNDHPSTSKADVVQLLLETAQRLEERSL